MEKVREAKWELWGGHLKLKKTTTGESAPVTGNTLGFMGDLCKPSPLGNAASHGNR